MFLEAHSQKYKVDIKSVRSKMLEKSPYVFCDNACRLHQQYLQSIVTLHRYHAYCILSLHVSATTQLRKIVVYL